MHQSKFFISISKKATILSISSKSAPAVENIISLSTLAMASKVANLRETASNFYNINIHFHSF